MIVTAPLWTPSLRLAAVRALDAKVNGCREADSAIAAFREQLFVETGISEELVGLLKAEGVL